MIQLTMEIHQNPLYSYVDTLVVKFANSPLVQHMHGHAIIRGYRWALLNLLTLTFRVDHAEGGECHAKVRGLTPEG